MQNQLVNQDYLSNLIELSKEYQDEGLVSQLFQNLQNEYHLFLRDCQAHTAEFSQKREFQSRIHKLKNNFFNLGCEETGAILEDMYQALKAEHPDPALLRNLWGHFESASERTFSRLRDTLEHQH